MESHFNIVDLFFEAADKYPLKIAIIENQKKISFSELKIQVKETSNYFSLKGILKGDRVLVFVPMSIDLYRIVLAIFNIGATAVFLDEWVNKNRMEACCEVAQCKAFIGIFKARLLGIFSSEIRKMPIKLGTKYHLNVNGDDKEIHSIASDTALITFTTGSTGKPKAAKRTHGFLKEQFNALLETIDPHPDDIDMPVLPIVLLINLGVGCKSVIAKFKSNKPALMDAGKIYWQLKNNQVTKMVSSPYFIRKLSEYMISKELSLNKINKVFTGGAPVFPAEASILQKAFPEARIGIVYGSTEAEPISSINAKELEKSKNKILKGLPVGKPYEKTQVKILKIISTAINCASENELQQLMLPPGEIGEIIVSGPHVLREYFNNDEALKQNKIFVGNDCWHRTGDSGYLENGSLFLTGRCENLIIQDDKVIAPFMFENYFLNIKGVAMGTIMMFDNKLLAILELNKYSNKDQVRRIIMDQALKFDAIKFITKMPRDLRHYSKIDYIKLRKLIPPM
ncbi:MAG: AMP-binding protein [Bacteroidota bacterium]|nr:AMP-binding protein [Bacteroidota bacterium]